jgi:sporulation protein YlmC with PRC-barrel domain
MKLRTLTLGSAALAGLMLAAAPALADGNYSHSSTPAERVQTNALNSDAADNARSNTDANSAANDEYDAARAAYERSLNNYDARKAAYDNDRARYEDQRHDYDRDRAMRWSSFHNHDRYRDIVSFHSSDLIGMTVSTRSGDRIGRIRDVDFAPNGRVNRIAIGISNHRVAWLYADDVRYDPQARVFLIDLSSDQLDNLARMRQTGS